MTKEQLDWQGIDTAPRNGTYVQAEIPGYGANNIIYWMSGPVGGKDGWRGGWAFAYDRQEPPECWTDGVCWDVNEDGAPSVKPTRWKPTL